MGYGRRADGSVEGGAHFVRSGVGVREWVFLSRERGQLFRRRVGRRLVASVPFRSIILQCNNDSDQHSDVSRVTCLRHRRLTCVYSGLVGERGRFQTISLLARRAVLVWKGVCIVGLRFVHR